MPGVSSETYRNPASRAVCLFCSMIAGVSIESDGVERFGVARVGVVLVLAERSRAGFFRDARASAGATDAFIAAMLPHLVVRASVRFVDPLGIRRHEARLA